MRVCMLSFQPCKGNYNVEAQVLDSAAYVIQTRDQQRFTISEVAADCREL